MQQVEAHFLEIPQQSPGITEAQFNLHVAETETIIRAKVLAERLQKEAAIQEEYRIKKEDPQEEEAILNSSNNLTGETF